MKSDNLGISEAARLMGISSSMVRKMITQGKLDTEKTPYGHMLTREVVDAEMARRAAIIAER